MPAKKPSIKEPEKQGWMKRTGKTHLIIAHPFSLESARAFARNGEELELEVVE